MRNASLLLKSITALFIAGFPLGGSHAHERDPVAAIAILSAAACAEPGRSFRAIDSFQTSSPAAGVTLAQACESPRCPSGRIPCNYQIRPNGCVAWRCCIGR
jgi:hypothetical protein